MFAVLMLKGRRKEGKSFFTDHITIDTEHMVNDNHDVDADC